MTQNPKELKGECRILSVIKCQLCNDTTDVVDVLTPDLDEMRLCLYHYEAMRDAMLREEEADEAQTH